MNGEGFSVMENVGGNAGRETYALTDEQILGMDGEAEYVSSIEGALNASRGPAAAATGAAASAQDDRRSSRSEQSESISTLEGAQAEVPVPQKALQEPPKWLTREMNDPWVGDEARELWEDVQRTRQEIAEFREAVGTREDARALKEAFPGGVAEAKNAAERAQELAEIDAVVFGTPGRAAEELRAGRAQLVERLFAQDAAALREMVEIGARLLQRAGNESGSTTGRDQGAGNLPRSLRSVTSAPQFGAEEQAGMPAPQGVIREYREFERAANGELERSVGAAIGKAMEAALPNLRFAESGEAGREGQAHPLQERLRVAVRDEVEAGLRSDAALGEQVARILSGRRFDEAARSQVVRLIDARAQQLVPGAVKRVVGSWTAATLGSKKSEMDGDLRRPIATPEAVRKPGSREQTAARNSQVSARRPVRGRVDYRRWSDEQILEM